MDVFVDLLMVKKAVAVVKPGAGGRLFMGLSGVTRRRDTACRPGDGGGWSEERGVKEGFV